MFRVSARTVLELGSELISSDIIAFYELIKNGFDAGTTTGVEVRFHMVLRRNHYLSILARIQLAKEPIEILKKAIEGQLDQSAPEDFLSQAEESLQSIVSFEDLRTALEEIHGLNSIVVSDSGSGMSLEDLEKNFLTIGTASRKREVDRALSQGKSSSPFLGEKGIGRLSAMRLGESLRVETATKTDTYLSVLDVNWNDFSNLDAYLEDIVVSPEKGDRKDLTDWSGTRIVIRNLCEDWTEDRVAKMAEYDFARITDPFLDPKDRPKIRIVWNGRRHAIPWMSPILANNAHARITGTYSIVGGSPSFECLLEAIDLGFPHPKETQRHVLDMPELESAVAGTSQVIHDSALKSVGPFKIEAHWFNRRRLTKIEGIGDLKDVRELQQKWSGILLFRDGFRVFPYGDDEDDWLALDRKALGRSGYLLNKTQFVGRVIISRTKNPDLVDQTNREGLRETAEQQVFIGVMQFAINTLMVNFLKEVERQYKDQKIDLEDAKSEIISLQKRGKDALRRIRSIAPKEAKASIEELEQAFFEFNDFSERARQRIAQVEEEGRQMIEMAGVGMMVEVVAHELARVSENALENLEKLRGKSVPNDVKVKLESLRSAMKSLSKRVRILDPMSVSGRQRSEIIVLSDLIDEIKEAHEAQFKRHNIHLDLDLGTRPIRVRAVKGMVIQIIENLISNSKYWMQMRSLRESSYQPVISISAHSTPPTIIYSDNGKGISPANREKIFTPFFSLKEKAKRRGLGLFIAKECAAYNGVSFELSDQKDPNTGRLHQFVLEFPKIEKE